MYKVVGAFIEGVSAFVGLLNQRAQPVCAGVL
jgi:hypothetical protein